MRHRPAEAAPRSREQQQPQQRRQRWWQASSQKQLSKGIGSGEEGQLSRCDQKQSEVGARCVTVCGLTLKRGRPMDEMLCPGQRTSLRHKEKGHGVHGQHEGSSRVIHLSRGRRPNDYNMVKASDGRSVIRCGTRSAPALKQRTNRRCRGPSHAFSRHAASRPPTKA